MWRENFEGEKNEKSEADSERARESLHGESSQSKPWRTQRSW